MRVGVNVAKRRSTDLLEERRGGARGGVPLVLLPGALAGDAWQIGRVLQFGSQVHPVRFWLLIRSFHVQQTLKVKEVSLMHASMGRVGPVR